MNLRIRVKFRYFTYWSMAGFVIGGIIMAHITGIPGGADMSGYAFLKDNIWMLLADYNDHTESEYIHLGPNTNRQDQVLSRDMATMQTDSLT